MKDTFDMARAVAGDDWGLFKDFMPELKQYQEAKQKSKILT